MVAPQLCELMGIDFLGQRFPLTCATRARSASPATGSKASHMLEQKMLIDEAFK